MKIAAREMNLLFATLAVVLLALTYLALEPKLQEWADFGEQREDLQARRDAEHQLLIALACHGLGEHESAKAALDRVLAFTNSDPQAVPLRSRLAG